MKKSVLSYEYFRGGFAWLLLIFGCALYCCGFFWISPNSAWKEVVLKVADVLVIGVILGYLSNAAQFLGIFKQDLESIIFGKEFISKRNDLDTVWENVTKQMFKNKFPSLHKDLLSIIRGYLPNDEISYYNDFENHISIEWVDKEKGVIKATDDVEFELIADNSNSFIYPIKSWVTISEGNHKWFKNEITRISINEKNLSLEDNMKESKKEGDSYCETVNVSLSGASRYGIKYTRVRQYSINDDNYIGFRAHYIVNKLRVCIDAPDDIKVLFTCRGTTNDFEDVPQKGKRIEKKYKGLILPRQGFLFILSKIEK